jgi:hypothetical protein
MYILQYTICLHSLKTHLLAENPVQILSQIFRSFLMLIKFEDKRMRVRKRDETNSTPCEGYINTSSLIQGEFQYQASAIQPPILSFTTPIYSKYTLLKKLPTS